MVVMGSALLFAAVFFLLFGALLVDQMVQLIMLIPDLIDETITWVNSTFNLELSQARAEAVMLALEGRQVDVSAMRAKGYGETAPIADNGEEAGREANRRIEFIFAGAAPEAGNSPNEEVARAAAAAAAAGQAEATPAGAPSLAPTEKTLAPRARPAKQEG